ncbi:hypothetical protein FQ014_24310, partial [Escherichia coli]|uniref:hypothetical protein n=1 Tax=Escherichia coli TaxID=562 RepID=UPI00135DDF96
CLLNSKLSYNIINIINPTIAINVGEIAKIPLHNNLMNNKNNIENLTLEIIDLHKKDWDEKENSWNFYRNALIDKKSNNLKEALLRKYANDTIEINRCHSIESELNHQINITYDLKSYV